MIAIIDYISGHYTHFTKLKGEQPWKITQSILTLLYPIIHIRNTGDYYNHSDIAIHKTAIIEQGALLKGPLTISEKYFVGSHAYIRRGVFFGADSHIAHHFNERNDKTILSLHERQER